MGPHHQQRRPFFLLFTDIFSENRTSEDVCNQIARASHCLNPALVVDVLLGQTRALYAFQAYGTAIFRLLLCKILKINLAAACRNCIEQCLGSLKQLHLLQVWPMMAM